MPCTSAYLPLSPWEVEDEIRYSCIALSRGVPGESSHYLYVCAQTIPTILDIGRN